MLFYWAFSLSSSDSSLHTSVSGIQCGVMISMLRLLKATFNHQLQGNECTVALKTIYATKWPRLLLDKLWQKWPWVHYNKPLQLSRAHNRLGATWEDCQCGRTAAVPGAHECHTTSRDVADSACVSSKWRWERESSATPHSLATSLVRSSR